MPESNLDPTVAAVVTAIVGRTVAQLQALAQSGKGAGAGAQAAAGGRAPGGGNAPQQDAELLKAASDFRKQLAKEAAALARRTGTLSGTVTSDLGHLIQVGTRQSPTPGGLT
jgi:hypothetical protein